MRVLKGIATLEVSNGYFSGIISIDDIADCEIGALDYTADNEQASNCGISGIHFTGNTPEDITTIAPKLIGAVQHSPDAEKKTLVAFVVTGIPEGYTLDQFRKYAKDVAATLPRHFHLAVFDPEEPGKVSLLTIHDRSGDTNIPKFVENRDIDTTQWVL